MEDFVICNKTTPAALSVAGVGYISFVAVYQCVRGL